MNAAREERGSEMKLIASVVQTHWNGGERSKLYSMIPGNITGYNSQRLRLF